MNNTRKKIEPLKVYTDYRGDSTQVIYHPTQEEIVDTLNLLISAHNSTIEEEEELPAHAHCRCMWTISGCTNNHYLNCKICGNYKGTPPQETKESWDFMECDTCRAKPGSPELCSGCYANRNLISKLRSERNAVLEEVNKGIYEQIKKTGDLDPITVFAISKILKALKK